MKQTKYEHWDLLDELPDGWSIDKTCGSPLFGYVFCTNGKSLVTGMQQRALVKVCRHKKAELGIEKSPTIKKHDTEKPEVENSKPKQETDLEWRRTLNNLARRRCEMILLGDIKMDLLICEIEGWSKIDYINEIRKVLSEINC